MITSFTIIVIHFIADFFFQTDKMAINKSKSVYWLTVHVCVYTFILMIGCFFLDFSSKNLCFVFIGLNCLLHWITDFCTSRLTSWIYMKNEKYPNEIFLYNSWRHWFFTAIGFDQVIHYACLFFTYQYLK